MTTSERKVLDLRASCCPPTLVRGGDAVAEADAIVEAVAVAETEARDPADRLIRTTPRGRLPPTPPA